MRVSLIRFGFTVTLASILFACSGASDDDGDRADSSAQHQDANADAHITNAHADATSNEDDDAETTDATGSTTNDASNETKSDANTSPSDANAEETTDAQNDAASADAKATDAGVEDAHLDARNDAPSDAGHADAQSATHNENIVPDQGGPTLTTPTLVSITYSDFTDRAAVDTFGDWLVTSDYLRETASEYGWTSSTHIKGHLTDAAPSSIDVNDIPTYIAAQIKSGALPATGANPSKNIYAIYFPSTTTLLDGGENLCVSAGGYHDDATADDGDSFAYIVVPDCGDEGSTALDNYTIVISHEFLEALTDPLPDTMPAYYYSDIYNPWYQYGGELADMCSTSPTVTVGGYEVVPIWSNKASAAGGDPCVPSTSFFTVDVSPSEMQPVAAGASITFDLTGWSTEAVSGATLYVVPISAYYNFVAFTPTATLGAPTLTNNGVKTTLTVSVPSGTPSGSGSLVYVGSTTSTFTGALAGVYVP